MQKIFIDIDNTLISYESVYSRICKRFSIQKNQKESYKNILKIFIYKNFDQNKADEIWHFIQAKTYSDWAIHSTLFSGVEDFLFSSSEELVLISHKSKRPYSRKLNDVDLQDYALKNLNRLGLDKFNLKFFESVEEKINFINEETPDFLIDDLMMILEKSNGDVGCKVLFGVDESKNQNILRLSTWNSISDLVRFSGNKNLKAKQVNHNFKNNSYILYNEKNRFFSKVFNADAINGKRLQREIENRKLLDLHGIQKNDINYIGFETLIIDFHEKKPFSFDKNFYQLFEGKLNLLKNVKNSEMANSTDPCFFLSDYIDIPNLRIERLRKIINKDELKYFNRIEEYFNLAKKKFLEEKLKLNFSNEINDIGFCFSDFCSENIIYNGKDLIFVDFESTGLDDTVKMASNLIQHPLNHFAAEERECILNIFLKVYNTDGSWLQRLNLVQELWSINWLCIILNKAIETKKFDLLIEKIEEHERNRT